MAKDEVQEVAPLGMASWAWTIVRVHKNVLGRPPLGVWMSYPGDWRRLWITRFTIGARHGMLIGVVGSTIGDSQQVTFNRITWWGFLRRWVGIPLMGLPRWSRFKSLGFMARSGFRYQCVGSRSGCNIHYPFGSDFGSTCHMSIRSAPGCNQTTIRIRNFTRDYPSLIFSNSTPPWLDIMFGG